MGIENLGNSAAPLKRDKISKCNVNLAPSRAHVHSIRNGARLRLRVRFFESDLARGGLFLKIYVELPRTLTFLFVRCIA